MNLRSLTNTLNHAFAGAGGKTGQVPPAGSRSKWMAAGLAVWGIFSITAEAQTNYFTANGGEYDVVGSLPGDQVWPDVAISTNGGFVVWQDNATDGDGWGISARRLDSTLSGNMGVFRVNDEGAFDQQNAHVAMRADGGAVFVWEGGERGSQHIFARFLSADNTWLKSGDISVSSAKYVQTTPQVAVLAGGNVVVVWSSFNQAAAGSMQDVYAKILSPNGGVVKGEFLVNQFTTYNQKSPVVTALSDGGFVIAWVSEQQRRSAGVLAGTNTLDAIQNASVDVYARVFNKRGAAQTGEFLVNAGSAPCANPSIASAADGSYLVAWSARDTVVFSNGWDVCARSFSAADIGGPVVLLNDRLPGNQYAPRLASVGSEYLAVWTSLGQDGSREGVYGRFIHNDGALTGDEFRVNSTTVSQQLEPVVASDGESQLIAIWTSYTAGPNSFDLFAQRFINANSVLQRMAAPFVNAPFDVTNDVYQPKLEVSWAPLAGIEVAGYEIYVDGSLVPAVITQSNAWVMTAVDGLTTDSTHTFRLAYVKADNARSPLSAATEGKTWSGLKWGKIPREWMIAHYGSDTNNWPLVGSKLGSGGPTLAQVFLSGGDPLDPDSWLTTKLAKTGQGMFLNWNTRPGFRYQVQVTTNFINWSNLGAPRFAAGKTDSIFVGGGAAGYYRVVLQR